MPELADSYCERCGARYAFNPNASKAISLKGARVLAKGLKNFVMNDEASLDDAMASARIDVERGETTRIAEEFHRTFNFCMTCRQYACERCWNAKAGACLSCAPVAGSQPVAPEDHLIVRTPVARFDTDWSLFPEGTAFEPPARPAPLAPFDEPIRLAEPQKPLPSQDPAAEIWPAGDLAANRATGPAAGNARKGRSAYQKSVDAQAASLWPITDEIAPEMTLTPEELELVETRLGQADSLEEAQSVEETVAVEASPAVEEVQPVEASPAVEPLPDSYQPAEHATVDAARSAPPVPAWVVNHVEPRGQPSMPAPAAEWPSEELMADAPVEPQEILRTPIAEPALPPLSPATSERPAHERVPIVGRLLGRHDPRPHEGASPSSPRPSERPSQPSRDPWPHATQWSDRPLDGHDRWAETDAAFGEPAPEPSWPDAPVSPVAAEQAFAAAPQEIDLEPAALELPAEDADARSAAAVRLSAVAATRSDRAIGSEFLPSSDEEATQAPAAQQPLFDPSQVAQEGVDPDVLEAIRNGSVPAPNRTPARRSGPSASELSAPAGPESSRPAPSGPWPPLGASWPAPADTNAPWPGPEGAPVPAAFALQQTEVPILAEMWAESAQEVLNRGSVRVCHHCALPVSTQARYCRRCGTQQA